MNSLKVRLQVLLGLLCASAYVTSAAELASIKGNGVSEDVAKDKTRDGRVFSLFAVVTFENSQCVTVTDTTMRGTCMSTTDCSDNQGTADGNCASGFGVCCMFNVAACGGAVTQNCTYISNAGFPTAVTTGTCTYVVTPCTDDICQLRFDFNNFVLDQPDANGICANGEDFSAVSPTGVSPPSICGNNAGQHMYLEVGRSTANIPVSVNLDPADTATARTWKIKVTQIECTSLSRAPTDCVQYFTGNSGTATSYNYPMTTLANQNYATCVRPSAGFCSINYSETAQAMPDTFNLPPIIAAAPVSETSMCSLAFVQVNTNTAVPGTNNFCGGFFNAIDAQTVGGTVVQETRPFMFNFRTTPTPGANALGTGYSLDFNQVPCM